MLSLTYWKTFFYLCPEDCEIMFVGNKMCLLVFLVGFIFQFYFHFTLYHDNMYNVFVLTFIIKGG